MTSPDADIPTTGSANVIPLIASRKSSSIGSINGEWNACDTLSCLYFHCLAILRTSSSSPASTTVRGPLIAAIDTFPVRYGVTSSSEAMTDTIAPPAGNICINAALAVIS